MLFFLQYIACCTRCYATQTSGMSPVEPVLCSKYRRTSSESQILKEQHFFPDASTFDTDSYMLLSTITALEAHNRTHCHDELKWVFVDPNRGLVFLHHDCLLSRSTCILENKWRSQDRNSDKVCYTWHQLFTGSKVRNILKLLIQCLPL